MKGVKHVDSPLLCFVPVSHVWKLGLVHILFSLPAFRFPLFLMSPSVTPLTQWVTLGKGLWTWSSGGSDRERGGPVANTLAGHTSSPPPSRHLELLHGTATHSSLPFCLSPQGTPAFLSACGSHKSDYPPALLTTHPRERVRGWAWLGRATKPLFMYP